MQKQNMLNADVAPIENDPGDTQQSDDSIKTGLVVEGKEPSVENKDS